MSGILEATAEEGEVLSPKSFPVMNLLPKATFSKSISFSNGLSPDKLLHIQLAFQTGTGLSGKDTNKVSFYPFLSFGEAPNMDGDLSEWRNILPIQINRDEKCLVQKQHSLGGGI